MTVTLAGIEQAVARRCGPYAERTVSSTLADSTTTLAYFDELKSTSNPGGVTDMYLLRRGYKSDGTTVSVSAYDRQRIAAEYAPLAGSVTPDRPWSVAPVDGEIIEFHHLDPALELRPAVLAGLRRCFFADRAIVTLSGASAERNLTASLFWVTKPTQVRRVQFSTAGSTTIPADQNWWRPFQVGSNVWLAGWQDAYPNLLYVTALRAHFTWVNGADSTTGPTADSDLLSLDLLYAAAAGHIEAWRICKPRLVQAASAGFQDSQDVAANEFTSQARANIGHRPREFGLSAPFSTASLSATSR
jgi:hypothetical protein